MSLATSAQRGRSGSPLRDPFRIARATIGGDGRDTTVIVELRDDDLVPGLVGLGEGYPDRYYGETPETMAAVLPAAPRARSSRRLDDLRGRSTRARGARATRRAWSTRRSPTTARPSARSTSRSTTSSASASALPVRELLGLSADDPADRLHDRHRRAGGRRRARRAGRPTSRRSRSRSAAPRTSRRSRRSARSSAGPIRVDANTGWTPDEARAPAARARRGSASS